MPLDGPVHNEHFPKELAIGRHRAIACESSLKLRTLLQDGDNEMKGVVPIVSRADLLPNVDGMPAVQPDADDQVGEAALAPSVEQLPSAAQGGDATHNEGGQAHAKIRRRNCSLPHTTAKRNRRSMAGLSRRSQGLPQCSLNAPSRVLIWFESVGVLEGL